MSEVKQEWLRAGKYLGEISALCFLKSTTSVSSLPYLVVGMGSEIILYDLGTGKEIRSFRVFDGIRVHGISSTGGVENEHLIAVYGEKKVKLFMLSIRDAGDVDLVVCQLLPKCRHWVLDVCFLMVNTNDNSPHVAVGCSDNSVLVWDTVSSSVFFEVKSPDVCLLYSLRFWGDELKDLHIASGTIFNEIIVWRVQSGPASLNSSVVEGNEVGFQSEKDHQLKAVHLCKLTGHEGSIFRLTWSTDGSQIVSVSDDRCARLWRLPDGKKSLANVVEVHNTVLHGHTARVWDCCLSESFVFTTGEDCTCRVWDLYGVQLKMIKEHIGRGIWRCLYDPTSSLLVTAGFDSLLKVHQLDASSLQDRCLHSESFDKLSTCSLHLPNTSVFNGHMNSKSEYVRCLHFTNEDTLYVATNNGFLFRVNISEWGNAKWTELAHVSMDSPIICMDVLSNSTCGTEDWIAVGDGKGRVSIVRVMGDGSTPVLEIPFMWSAESERQLLGIFWSESLGNRFIFSSDPRGTLKLWKLHSDTSGTLVAEFLSCFGTRLICIDASLESQVVVCGDLRGNLILFSLSKDILSASNAETRLRMPPLSYFKGVHGISSIASVSISYLSSNLWEIRSSGGDGCLCYLQYDVVLKTMEFIGLKQVKELSLIQSVRDEHNCTDDLGSGTHAIGFTSGNFLIWNLLTETKVADIPCGGWRRPYSFFLGDVPELAHCFAYVKDEVIHVHKYWIPVDLRMTIPKSLHIQFHGREIHSLCFITEDSKGHSDATRNCVSRCSYVASGSEDGTVRLSKYTSSAWSESKTLGEHVGGSAVRSIFPVSDIHMIELDKTFVNHEGIVPPTASPDAENPFLLISVGAKRVLTTWILRKRKVLKQTGDLTTVDSNSMTFQWLSSDMPAIKAKPQNKNVFNVSALGVTNNDNSGPADKKEQHSANSVSKIKDDTKDCAGDASENDFRYMAVTAFLVKGSQFRSTVCFVVVACSDGSLAMRALLLPQRFWFDVTEFFPVSSPVLVLQHIVVPSPGVGRYIVISGSTNGSVTFWDLTESVHSFICWISTIQIEKSIEGPKRPRTGRGSQGGRWWKSTSGTGNTSRKKKDNGPDSLSTENANKDHLPASTNTTATLAVESEAVKEAVLFQTHEVHPLHVVSLVHQSGVNCLHISKIKSCQNLGDSKYLVLSGGDDQALHSLLFDVELLQTSPGTVSIASRPVELCKIRCLCQDKIASSHSSAVKGVWTDGKWAFSTGLDQRVRCWHINKSGNLCEQAHLVISVPEPETLSARAYEIDGYEIAVAGRGMQLIEFHP